MRDLKTKNFFEDDAYFKWRPSDFFDDRIFESKKEELDCIVALFFEAKSKRKTSKPPSGKDEDSEKAVLEAPSQKQAPFDALPIMATKFEEKNLKKNLDAIYSPKSKYFDFSIAEETEEESLQDLSFGVNLNEKKVFVPKKLNYSDFDINNDGFDIIPEFLEVLPKGDPQETILNKKSLKKRKIYKNFKKRKAVGLVIDTLFHKWDPNYIVDKKLPLNEQTKRKKTRYEFSRVAWREVIKCDIRKEYNKMISMIERKAKLSKLITESVATLLQKRYELPSGKEITTKARKLVYEMQTYWRKVDRETDETKKKKTKDVITERKKYHSEKEVKRQGQRLDFLLRQTEIFSHFIGARMGLNISSQKPESSGSTKNNSVESLNSKSRLGVDILGNVKEGNEDDKKAAKAAIEFMNSRKNETRAFEEKMAQFSGNEVYKKTTDEKEEQIGEMDLLNPSLMPSKTNIKEPEMFVGTLKSYQLKGLNWLVNLYDHSINGILADEMGLGKTIQSIAFIAHLCEVENLWGPYLVIAPNSVVHNWCYEFEQFTPTIKVLPYWGQQKDREVLRKFWKPELLYSSKGEFHVMVTSYSTFQTDEKHFKKMKWHFIILDEAHAIKNSQSNRWKSLLSLECRNRLLLTGTPIQNSMAELWSLLHYIMPSIFQKHSEFKEWFSKNIEDHAEGKSLKLNSGPLKRLHMILKPFMLRRIKHDVEHEMAPKKEIVIKCELSSRQKTLYNAIKDKFKEEVYSLNETFVEKDLYNAVMQFRKVCNHPEIYKKRIKQTPFGFFTKSAPEALLSDLAKNFTKEIFSPSENPISYSLPRLIFDDSLLSCSKEKVFWGIGSILEKFSVFSADNVRRSTYEGDSKPAGNSEKGGCFAFNRIFELSPSEVEFVSRSDVIYRWLFHIGRRREMKRRHENHTQSIESDGVERRAIDSNEENEREKIFTKSQSRSAENLRKANKRKSQPKQEENRKSPQTTKESIVKKSKTSETCGNSSLGKSLWNVLGRESSHNFVSGPGKFLNGSWSSSHRTFPGCRHLDSGEHENKLKVKSLSNRFRQIFAYPKVVLSAYLSKCQAAPISIKVSRKQPEPFGDFEKALLVNSQNERLSAEHLTLVSSRSLHIPASLTVAQNPFEEVNLLRSQRGLLFWVQSAFGTNGSKVEQFSKDILLSDCGKLKALDKLLFEKKRDNHRVLIFSQMTKMLDILEEYCNYRKYKFLRLDGSTQITDRTIKVKQFQRDPEIFIFLLSTRAGGLGINLTAADTVIFYDNDWNPTMDAQAMDRVHRIGQKKQVTVYRMICRNTVEERVWNVAQQKYKIQTSVYSGGFKFSKDKKPQEEAAFKPKQLKELILEED